MSFQRVVNTQPAPAVAGDFASANPYGTVDAGPGAFVAGLGGLTIGRFAWQDAIQKTVTNSGSGPVTGFVHRTNEALITQYLQTSSMLIPAGFEVTLMNWGDFWVKNDGANAVTLGMKAYANFADGKVTFAATGAPSTVASATGSIAPSTGSFTGSIVDNVLTIATVGSGTAVVGGTLSGTGVVSGTKITDQIDGTPGGVGTYHVSIGSQSVAVGTTISETYGTFTAASALTGTFGVGDVLSGSGVTNGTVITAVISAPGGGLGTYVVSPTQTAGSTTISAAGNVETKWYASSVGAPGDLIKMTSIPPG